MLKPARQGLPEAVPAVGSGVVPRAVVVPPSTPVRAVAAAPVETRPPVPATEEARPAGASPEPARPTTGEPAAAPVTAPAARAIAVGPSAPTPRAPAAYASPALTSSYAAQQAQLESRHVQEFAKPPAGESPQALSARQQSEHRTLDATYHQAAAAGRTSMPPLAAPRYSPPPPRPPSAPAPHR